MVDGGRDRSDICLVHRLTRGDTHPSTLAADGSRFHLLDSPWKLAKVWRTWTRRTQQQRLPRVAARLIAPSHAMYCVAENGVIVHEGWMVIGRSPLYDVGPEDVVFGPISTSADARGRGLATFGLEHAIGAMTSRGHRTFYIHTRERNAASRRVIDKCGFGPPVARISMGLSPSSPSHHVS